MKITNSSMFGKCAPLGVGAQFDFYSRLYDHQRVAVKRLGGHIYSFDFETDPFKSSDERRFMLVQGGSTPGKTVTHHDLNYWKHSWKLPPDVFYDIVIGGRIDPPTIKRSVSAVRRAWGVA